MPRRLAPLLARSSGPSAGFDWLMILASAWIIAGAYYDSWAHRHVAALDSFLTPYHAILYSGLLVATLLVAGRLAWSGLPRGYEMSLLGCLLFGVGGLLDLGWHAAFGIERGLAAALSPTHLLLMLTAGLIVAGPLRSAWRSPIGTASWRAVGGAALVLAALTFYGQFDHPFISQWSAAPRPPAVWPEPYEQLGVFGVLMHTAFLMSVVLLLLIRLRPPFGALTVIMTTSGFLVTLLDRADPVILVGVLGGLTGDVLNVALRPSGQRIRALRAFSMALPLSLWLLYFAGIQRAGGIWWPVHIVIGAVVASAICGLLISYLVAPPRGALAS